MYRLCIITPNYTIIVKLQDGACKVEVCHNGNERDTDQKADRSVSQLIYQKLTPVLAGSLIFQLMFASFPVKDKRLFINKLHKNNNITADKIKE